jgi:hypothetical protein
MAISFLPNGLSPDLILSSLSIVGSNDYYVLLPWSDDRARIPYCVGWHPSASRTRITIEGQYYYSMSARTEAACIPVLAALRALAAPEKIIPPSTSQGRAGAIRTSSRRLQR